MTIGISKERLIDFDPWAYDNQQDLLNEILEQCTELNPLVPIDENTPTDKNLLVYFDNGSMEVARNCGGTWLDNDNLDFDYCEITPTHWQELPEDPKGE